MAEKTLPTDQIEMSLFQHFVVRVLLLIATGVMLLLRKEADNRLISRQDAKEYEEDYLALSDAIDKHLR